MINILKCDISRLLKSKIYYIICALLGGYTVVQIYLNFFYHGGNSIGERGASTLITFIRNPNILVVLFVILTGKFILEEYSNGAIKNILGRGILRESYFFSKIISTYAIALLTSIIFIIIQVIISTMSAGFGVIDYPEYIILGIILDMIYLLAIIIIMIGIISITRNGIAMVIILVGTLNIFKIIMFMLAVCNIHIKINLLWFEMSTYVGLLEHNNIIPIKGIVTAIVYIIIFLVVGIYAIRKQDVR